MSTTYKTRINAIAYPGLSAATPNMRIFALAWAATMILALFAWILLH